MLDVFDGLVLRFLGRSIARQFVVFGGVSAVLQEGSMLVGRGIIPTYNRIDEHIRERWRINEICESYVRLVSLMDNTNYGSVAIKPSAFGMELGSFMFAKTLQNFIRAISGKALEIEIDAENRETLCDVQRVLNALAPKLPRGVTFRPAFQMHLPKELRTELVDRYRILDMPVRIVKGSGLYNVGAEEASDEEVRGNYFETFRMQIAKGMHPKVATVRDRRLLGSLKEVAGSGNISADQFTIQFLAGPFGRSLSREHAALGYRVGCYVPFVDLSAPDEWVGYVRRRIAFGRKLMFRK